MRVAAVRRADMSFRGWGAVGRDPLGGVEAGRPSQADGRTPGFLRRVTAGRNEAQLGGVGTGWSRERNGGAVCDGSLLADI